MDYTTWIEINKNALEHNVAQYKLWLPAKTEIAAVVKANAYGHGIQAIGKILQRNSSIKRFCVANSQEGINLRTHGVTKPILVLGFINTPLETIAEYDLDCVVSNLKILQDLQNLGKIFNKKINVHVKIDTGLSRLGFLPKDVHVALDTIKYLPNLHLQGIWSHLTESFNQELIHQQEEVLKQFWQPNIQIHIANSNACLLTKYHYDFARIGAGIYGYLPEADPKIQQLLHPIINFKTKIINIKKIPTGSSVGYGKTNYTTTKPTTIATLGMGYYEGLDPDLLATGKVLIHGQYAPIVGRINMNCFMVDVTHIPQAELNATVTILGQDGDKYITPYDWRIGAQKNVRIFLARLNNDLPRIIVEQPVINMHDSIIHNSQILL
ncbi:alanine racemase [Candidatus Dependentiae bacterium]|nr:alanine racemase [Candidatus Dependentiae bacterium]